MRQSPTSYRGATEDQRLRQLARMCILFVDRNGTVLDRGSTPFSAWLQMEYSVERFYIFFRVTQSPYSNGYCYVEVKSGGRIVFMAEGEFITSPVIKTVGRYSKGVWERRVRR